MADIPDRIWIDKLYLSIPIDDYWRKRRHPEDIEYIRVPPRKPGKQVLLDMIEHSLCVENDYGNLSDAEFAEVLLNEVWAEMSVDTKECALVEMAIERLRGKR